MDETVMAVFSDGEREDLGQRPILWQYLAELGVPIATNCLGDRFELLWADGTRYILTPKRRGTPVTAVTID